MWTMQTSKTFTTPSGARVSTRANKLYAVVGVVRTPDGPKATVLFRTDLLDKAVGRQRAEVGRMSCPFEFVHVFRKADGARLIGGQWVRGGVR
jgi:hypothetical protein